MLMLMIISATKSSFFYCTIIKSNNCGHGSCFKNIKWYILNWNVEECDQDCFLYRSYILYSVHIY